MSDDDISILLEGDNMIPASIDDAAEFYEHRIRMLEFLLTNVEESQIRFWEYIHDPFVNLKVYFDKDTKDYVLEVNPSEGKAYQDALNERMGINPKEE